MNDEPWHVLVLMIAISSGTVAFLLDEEALTTFGAPEAKPGIEKVKTALGPLERRP